MVNDQQEPVIIKKIPSRRERASSEDEEEICTPHLQPTEKIQMEVEITENEYSNKDTLNLSDEPQTKSNWRSTVARIDPLVGKLIQWAFTTLLILFLLFVVFGILYSGIHYHNANDESKKCVTSFGSLVGIQNGVFAYSNCNDEYTSDETFNISSSGIETGMKWQCVEFARRYWILRGSPVPATFDSVEGAADIWGLANVRLLGGSSTPLLKFPNGLPAALGGSAPRVGDLLIYPRQPGGFPFGHVAVVVLVGDAAVQVAEQNWNNAVWPAPHHNFSRTIPLTHETEKNSYTLNDEGGHVQGWVRYEVPG